MERLIPIILLAMVLAACGGSSGGTDAPALAGPENLVLDKSTQDSLTVSWQPVDNAGSYNLYIAKEPIADIGNYAALNGGTLVLGVTSPFTINNLSLGTEYHIRVSAMIGSRETAGSHPVAARPLIAGRYEPINDDGSFNPDGEVIRDWVNHLDWQRCPYGMTWNSTSHQCGGTAGSDVYVPDHDIGTFNIASYTVFGLPTTSQLFSLLYCDSTGTFFSAGDFTQTCASPTAPTVYPGVFTGMPSDHPYSTTNLTPSYSIANTYVLTMTVDFSDATLVKIPSRADRTLLTPQYVRKVRLIPPQ